MFLELRTQSEKTWERIRNDVIVEIEVNYFPVALGLPRLLVVLCKQASSEDTRKSG